MDVKYINLSARQGVTAAQLGTVARVRCSALTKQMAELVAENRDCLTALAKHVASTRGGLHGMLC